MLWYLVIGGAVVILLIAAVVAGAYVSARDRKELDRLVESLSAAGVDLDDEDSDSPFAGTFRFEYQSGSGEIDSREARITHVSHSSGRLYFEGYRTDTMEDRSYRVDRVVGAMISVDTGEIVDPDELVGLLGEPMKRDTTEFTPGVGAPDRGWKPGVFFAGFRGRKLDELEAIAEAGGWKVFSSLHKSVDYMVVNGQAGARQMAEAENLGVEVLDEDSFRVQVG